MTTSRVRKNERRFSFALAPSLSFSAVIALAFAVAGGGCAGAPKKGALLAPTAQAIAERTDSKLIIAWSDSAEEKTRSDEKVAALLREPLTTESALQIAILNNPSLRVTWAEIQLSQADVLAASRLSNPTLTASLRWPDQHPRGPDAEFSLAADLIDGLFLPLRRRWAEREVAQAQGRAADAVLGLICELKKAIITLEAHQLLRVRINDGLAVNRAAADLAQRQFDAGNITQLTLLNAQTSAVDTQLALIANEELLREDREAITRLLGVREDTWKLEGTLESPRAGNLPDDAALVSTALRQRLDLKLAHQAEENTKAALALKKRMRWLPASVSTGIDTERESPGDRLTGPTLSLALPLFNQGQDEIFRLTAEMCRTEARAEGLEVAVRSDVRLARARLALAAQTESFYETILLPQRRAILRATLLQYNAMEKNSYELLAAKHQELAGVRDQIEALRQYWLARIDLERAVGTSRLFESSVAPPPLPQP